MQRNFVQPNAWKRLTQCGSNWSNTPWLLAVLLQLTVPILAHSVQAQTTPPSTRFRRLVPPPKTNPRVRPQAQTQAPVRTPAPAQAPNQPSFQAQAQTVPLPRNGYAQFQERQNQQRQNIAEPWRFSSVESQASPQANPQTNSGAWVTKGAVQRFNSATSAIQFLALPSVVQTPSLKAQLQFPVNSPLELRVNGTVVGEDFLGERSVAGETVTQTWYGIPLKPGSNRLSATVWVNDQPQTVEQTVMLADSSSQLVISAREDRLPADGRAIATIEGQLLDADQNITQDETFVTLAASAGTWLSEDASSSQPGFQVKLEQGQFSTQLQAPRKAGIVRLRANTYQLEAYSEIQFVTEQRPGIVSGVADIRLGRRGLDYHDRFEDFDVQRDNSYGVESSGQIFATGSLGSWLFTGAYSSDRPLNNDGSLYDAQDQFDDNTYPVRGDSSTVEKLTPSQDHFYVRLERTPDIAGAEPDYLLWGDYGTPEWSRSSQQFTAMTRQLHGAKINYNLGDFQVSGLFANQIEGFQRDVIAPNGTTGIYFLAKRQVLTGSEDVFLEQEPLERPGTVRRRTRLRRGLDYEIDYDRGTLRFREPILRTEVDDNGDVLVQRIVSTYQFEGGDETHLYAARAQYHLNRGANPSSPGGGSWIGATAIRENKGDRDFLLYGADAQIQLGDRSRITAEYARSSNGGSASGEATEGQAYRVEASREGNRFSGRTYFRRTDSGFSNKSTNSFVAGQTRYGAEGSAKVGRNTRLTAGYDRETTKGSTVSRDELLPEILTPTSPQQFLTDQDLTTISAGVQQQLGSATVKTEFIQRERKDRINSKRSSQSSQVRTQVKVPIGNRVSLKAINQTTLSKESDAVYADRSQIGVDWEVSPGINLGVNQHWFHSGDLAGDSFTSVDLSGDYALGSNTQLTGRYAILSGINGVMGQGAVGIQHRWEVSPGLNLDVAYERGIGNWRNGGGDRDDPPAAVTANSTGLGTQPGNSMSVGLEYTGNPDWKASARYERSDTSGTGRSNVDAAVTGKLSPSLTGLLRLNHQHIANAKLEDLGPSTKVRIGLAYRDIDTDKLNALLRYEYRRNPGTTPDTLLLGSGTGSKDHVVAMEAIYAPNWRWEFYGKAALRYSESQLSRETIGNSTTMVAQLRATYRFHDSFDLGAEARWIGQSGGYRELGWLVEGGYFLTPDLRFSAGYVFGEVGGDRDFDGNQSASGPYMGVTVKLNELFGGFGEQEPVKK